MHKNDDTESVYSLMTQARQAGRKQIAVLIDPDKTDLNTLDTLSSNILASRPDYLLVGGSQVGMPLDALVLGLKRLTGMPITLFPGNASQVTGHATAILFLSLLSGRNPEFLIGQQAAAARKVKCSGIEVIPTAYVLVDGGRKSAVERMSGTQPIPRNNVDEIIDTALAGELMGMKTVYLEAGSGAAYHVPQEVVKAVRKNINGVLIVGGGLRSTKQIVDTLAAGADIVVVGNHFEEHPDDMRAFCETVRHFRCAE